MIIQTIEKGLDTVYRNGISQVY